VRVEREYRLLAHGLVVRATAAEAAALAALPGVRRVARADLRRYRPTLDASIPLIRAPDLWGVWPRGADQAGRGIKVAVVDTGIDIHNPFFAPDGFSYPSGFPRGAASFTTAKVIAARAYFRPDDPVDADEDEANPIDHLGHGSHVAGVIAGNYGTVFDLHGTPVTVSGVAPQAQLMDYKVFYRAVSGAEEASDPELMAAFEDAVADGADVISNSWGGPVIGATEVDPDGPFALAIEAGAVVVFAAGNDGPGESTVGWPGAGERFITVAATTTGRHFNRRLEVTGPAPVAAGLQRIAVVRGGMAPDYAASVVAPLRSSTVADGGQNPLGCEVFTQTAFQGAIALVKRGTCPFSVKIGNAAAAGALAVVVFNDEGGDPFPMSGDEVTVPAVMISQADGEALAAFAAAHPEDAAAILHADPTASVIPGEVDVVAGFSAVGPTATPTLKPDVAAPGYLIFSASAGPVGAGAPPWALLAGTSMATPHVAGAAALLLQHNPTWTHDDVKAALVATGKLDLGSSAGGPARPVEIGGGRIQLDRLAHVALAFDPPVLNLGVAQPGETVARPVTVRRLDPAAGAVTLAFRPATGAPPLAPADGTAIDFADERAAVELRLDTGAAGDATGWLVATTAAGEEYHAPYLLRVLPPRDRDLLLVDMSFAESTGVASPAATYAALAAAAGLACDQAVPPDSVPVPPLEELLRYRAVLVFTGEDQQYHLWPDGVRALNRIAEYLRAGGRVIVAGQGPLRGSNVTATLGLLGAQTQPDQPLRDPATGGLLAAGDYSVAPIGTPVLATGALHLDPAGAADLRLVGVAASVTSAAGAYSQPVFELQVGITGGPPGAVAFDPYPFYGLDAAAEQLRHRAILLEFGLEALRDPEPGVAAPGSPLEVLERAFAWVSEEVALDVTPTVAGTTLTLAAAASSAAGRVTRYTYRFGDDSPELETADATAAHAYERYGVVDVTVIARSDLDGAAVWRRQVYVGPGQDAGAPRPARDGGAPPPAADAPFQAGCGGCRVAGYPSAAPLALAVVALLGLRRVSRSRRGRR
jgi:subtilisin family serine protease